MFSIGETNVKGSFQIYMDPQFDNTICIHIPWTHFLNSGTPEQMARHIYKISSVSINILNLCKTQPNTYFINILLHIKHLLTNRFIHVFSMCQLIFSALKCFMPIEYALDVCS